MNIGITEPKYAILDDGSQVVVKLSRGPEGNLVLFNEYVCYRLAILIDRLLCLKRQQKRLSNKQV
ncbi:hypothetical protein EBB54_03375 [Schaedlerella arabinosiphila]|uniref:Uncharacterized protein n=1 Tax=Schaedlerella arabinosiphila TaxID=2044587 RepID=A0A3R8JKP8_9FIRM|nr:hypothetical protein EBB54_03375 [Schaedlerella arabinosiphila]